MPPTKQPWYAISKKDYVRLSKLSWTIEDKT